MKFLAATTLAVFLSFQGVSTSGLKELAAAAKTRSKRDETAEQLEAARLSYEQARQAYYSSSGDPAMRQAYYEARDNYYRPRRSAHSFPPRH